MRLNRAEVYAIYGAFTLGCRSQCLIFIIFLKFSQQLYEVDTIINPGLWRRTQNR